jgi:hypothetical protein
MARSASAPCHARSSASRNALSLRPLSRERLRSEFSRTIPSLRCLLPSRADVPSRRLWSISAISYIECNRADAADRLSGRGTRGLGSRHRAGDHPARLYKVDHGGLRSVRPAHRGRLCIGQARGFSRSRPLANRALGTRLHTVPEPKSRDLYDDVMVGIIPERNPQQWPAIIARMTDRQCRSKAGRARCACR